MSGDHIREALECDLELDLPTHPAGKEAISDRKVRIVSSDALLSGRGALAIRHKQAIYYLRETRFGKLILTK